jgi:hypothetical protein
MYLLRESRPALRNPQPAGPGGLHDWARAVEPFGTRSG